MIFFNGQALENAAPVKIEDIHVSPIQLSPVSQERAIRFGSQFVRMTGGTRTVAITFALLTDSLDERERQLGRITAWARSQQEGRLELPYHEGKFLQCICTSTQEPSLRQWWESKLRIVFTCYDNPFWTSKAEKTAACGTEFFVGGNAADGPLMQIERTLAASASNQTYSDGENTLTLSTIPAGNMIIDMNRQTIAVNGQSIMQHYAFGSRFPRPKNGKQTITGSGTVKWRERWE